jgi:hypothetical protein
LPAAGVRLRTQSINANSPAGMVTSSRGYRMIM